MIIREGNVTASSKAKQRKEKKGLLATLVIWKEEVDFKDNDMGRERKTHT